MNSVRIMLEIIAFALIVVLFVQKNDFIEERGNLVAAYRLHLYTDYKKSICGVPLFGEAENYVESLKDKACLDGVNKKAHEEVAAVTKK